METKWKVHCEFEGKRGEIWREKKIKINDEFYLLNLEVKQV